jgi:hypothetical protein
MAINITQHAAVTFERDHQVAAWLRAVGETLNARMSPAINALINARKIEIVFIRAPPS